jgi:hypothetical protein
MEFNKCRDGANKYASLLSTGKQLMKNQRTSRQGEICVVLGYYVASNGNLFFLDFLTLENGTDTLSQNVGKELPFDAA